MKLLTPDDIGLLKNKTVGFTHVVMIRNPIGNDIIMLRNGDFRVEIYNAPSKCIVKAYAWINMYEYGTEYHEVDTYEALYEAVRKYAKYFSTGGEVTKTMLWIKQLLPAA